MEAPKPNPALHARRSDRSPRGPARRGWEPELPQGRRGQSSRRRWASRHAAPPPGSAERTLLGERAAQCHASSVGRLAGGLAVAADDELAPKV